MHLNRVIKPEWFKHCCLCRDWIPFCKPGLGQGFLQWWVHHLLMPSPCCLSSKISMIATSQVSMRYAKSLWIFCCRRIHAKFWAFWSSFMIFFWKWFHISPNCWNPWRCWKHRGFIAILTPIMSKFGTTARACNITDIAHGSQFIFIIYLFTIAEGFWSILWPNWEIFIILFFQLLRDIVIGFCCHWHIFTLFRSTWYLTVHTKFQTP